MQVSWKCDLENVASVKIPDPVEQFEWHFQVLCSSCHEVHDKLVSFNANDRVSIPGSRGEANFVWKCSFCGRPGSANIEPKSIKSYEQEKNGQMQPLVVVECRGMEVVSWKCIGEFFVVAESGSIFESVDLGENEWADFDERSGESLSIFEISSEVTKV